MTTAVAPTAPAAPPIDYSTQQLTLTAPEGAHWSYEEVKTDKGTRSLGTNFPLLVWDNLDKMREKYGDDGVLAVADGTSLRVSFQNIVRRAASANKTFDEMAKTQIEFKPGKRVVGESTPASRVARTAKAAVEAGGVSEDNLTKLLEAIKGGKFSDEDIKSLVG
jgi:hypothetical protein